MKQQYQQQKLLIKMLDHLCEMLISRLTYAVVKVLAEPIAESSIV